MLFWENELDLVLHSRGMDSDQKWVIYTTFLSEQLDSDFSATWEITIVFSNFLLKHLYKSINIFINAMKSINLFINAKIN